MKHYFDELRRLELSDDIPKSIDAYVTGRSTDYTSLMPTANYDYCPFLGYNKVSFYYEKDIPHYPITLNSVDRDLYNFLTNSNNAIKNINNKNSFNFYRQDFDWFQSFDKA